MEVETNESPKWYSIRDAAKYLSVGEPTLFRWMREGSITFRKVGDSTRFLKEDLDAFVQIHPSGKDASQVREACPLCHHDKLAGGKLRSTGLNYFQPAKTKFWTLKDSSIDTDARMCMKCGAIMLFGNVGKMEKLMHPSEKKRSESQ